MTPLTTGRRKHRHAHQRARAGRVLDYLPERVHIACATMSTAPMAQTTMSKVMGWSSLAAAMAAPLSAPDLAGLEWCLARYCAAKSECVSVNEL